MRIALFNSYDDNGGASIATLGILSSLVKVGLRADLWVLSKTSAKKNVYQVKRFFSKGALSFIDSLPVYFYLRRNRRIFTSAWINNSIANVANSGNYDVINLFWVSGGFFRIESLENINIPIIWTLHDMWPLTGGCHYDEGCARYEDQCGKCPLLNSSNTVDLSNINLKRKISSWGSKKINIIATSSWIGKCAKASSIFKNSKISIVPNAIDVNKFKPFDKIYAKSEHNLNPLKKYILFSAHGAMKDARKGFIYFLEAIRILSITKSFKEYELVILGSGSVSLFSKENIINKVHFINFIDNEPQRVSLYSACDLLIAPSLQENLSNTVMESLSCGTPVVAFNVGGMPDLIQHKLTGYLAEYKDSSDLANGILYCLEDGEWLKQASINARKFVTREFSPDVVGKKYHDVYNKVISEI